MIELVAVLFTFLCGVASARFVRWLVAQQEPVVAGMPSTHVAVSRITGRILFVTRADADIVLDCIAGNDHPSRCVAPPGAPFAVRVSAFGSTWFADAMERFLERLAAEDRMVTFELASGPDGDRIDVHNETTRMRFDLRSRVGLT